MLQLGQLVINLISWLWIASFCLTYKKHEAGTKLGAKEASLSEQLIKQIS